MFAVVAVLALAAPDPLNFPVRVRTEVSAGTGRYHVEAKPRAWSPKETAVVVCDLWDRHWCPGATARVNELAPHVNAFVTALRAKGVLVVHCPSDTMKFYEGTPARKLAQSAPKATPKVPLERWCKLDPGREGRLPIDDSDGGCAETNASAVVWTRQHPAVTVADGDAVTDSDEAYHLFVSRGIKNVFVLGVHTNMCVLGRPFSIRQLVKQGFNVALVRDLTDAMYNPAKAPFVSHFTGTELVVEHIEKYWCPSTTAADVLGTGKPFRFAEDARPHVAIVTAEDEYKTETTLPAFALAELGKAYRVSVCFADATDTAHLPGLEVIDTADVLLLSVRRRPLRTAELDRVRKFIAAGKPVVAIRTSSHAFAPKAGQKVPDGASAWLTFDRDVLGCEYKGHHANTVKAVAVIDPTTHPLLANVPAGRTEFASSLYKSAPLAADAKLLLTGTAGDSPPEPLAWLREKGPGRGKVFYTSLGHADDFKNPAFVRLLANGIAWAAAK